MNRSIFLCFLTIISFVSLAQLGPGGVGTTDGTSTLEYWLDANNGIAGTAPITGVTDLSGNSITNTILGDPTLTTNALNGYSAITFDGTGDYISTSLSIRANVFPDLDVYAVYEQTGATSAVWGEDNGGFDRFIVDANGAASCDYAVSNGSSCTNRANMFPVNTPVITSIPFDEDATNGSSAIVNGVQSGAAFTSNHVPDNNGSNLFDVGSIGRNNFVMDGDIAEVFVFSENLNDAQQIILHNYLSAKYGIALTGNDYYDEDDPASGNYDHDVAGIGRVDASNLHDAAQGTGIVGISNPSGLGDDEFLIWGHDNGAAVASETSDIPTSIDARFDRVWRVSEENSSSTAVDVGTIDITFDLSAFSAVTASDLRLLVDTDNDGVFDDETPISGATSIGGGVYEFSGISAIANNLRFTLGTIDIVTTPLPVELISFSASVLKTRKVKLEWLTATEINNDHFTLERSKNGIDWEYLAEIDGAGNSNKELSYSHIDDNPFASVIYYRLKQTDFDGTIEYSDVVRVELNQLESTELNIYPNPSKAIITINEEGVEFEEISIFDMFGKEVTSRIRLIVRKESSLTLDLSSLSKGMYFLKTGTTANRIYKN